MDEESQRAVGTLPQEINRDSVSRSDPSESVHILHVNFPEIQGQRQMTRPDTPELFPDSFGRVTGNGKVLISLPC